MTNIGTLAQRVNSQGYNIYIASTNNKFLLLQNASLNISHSEFREPTTSGGIAYYSGLPDNVLSGTILYTSDLFDDGSTNDLKSLLTPVNGEYPINTLIIKLTGSDNSGSIASTATFTFDASLTPSTGAKITSCVIYKGVEGAVKADISFVLLGNPTMSALATT